jgi:hypothetical protein
VIYFLGATNVQTPGRVYFHRICGFNCSAFSNSSTVCRGAFGYVEDANAFQMNLSMLFQGVTNVSTFQVETPTNVVLDTGNSSLNSVTHAASALSIGTSCTTCNISYWAFLGNEAKGVLAVARVGTMGSGTISNLWFINNTCDPAGPTASPAYAQHALVVVAGSQTLSSVTFAVNTYTYLVSNSAGSGTVTFRSCVFDKATVPTSAQGQISTVQCSVVTVGTYMMEVTPIECTPEQSPTKSATKSRSPPRSATRSRSPVKSRSPTRTQSPTASRSAARTVTPAATFASGVFTPPAWGQPRKRLIVEIAGYLLMVAV